MAGEQGVDEGWEGWHCEYFGLGAIGLVDLVMMCLRTVRMLLFQSVGHSVLPVAVCNLNNDGFQVKLTSTRHQDSPSRI